VPRAIGANESSTREEQIARWFEQVRRPSDSLYVLCAGASIYALADVDPPYRALWFYEVHHVRGAQEELSTLLTSDDRPTFVVAIQKPKACGLTGEDADLLDDHYNSFATVGGTDIYIRAGDDRDANPADASGRRRSRQSATGVQFLLSSFDVFGAGRAMVEGKPLRIFVYQHADAADAAANEDAVRAVFEEGRSIFSGQPIRELLELGDVEVDGPTVVATFRILERSPRMVWQMVVGRDLPAAHR
jgi:hypothetical protein